MLFGLVASEMFAVIGIYHSFILFPLTVKLFNRLCFGVSLVSSVGCIIDMLHQRYGQHGLYKELSPLMITSFEGGESTAFVEGG